MRVLILTAGYGEGHNSAARALLHACNERVGCQAQMLDVFALRAPRLNHLSRRAYLTLINSAPRVWSRLYRWLDASPRAPAMFGSLASHRRMLGQLIARHQPDAIVSTYPVYGWMVNRLREETGLATPLYTVVTDAITINSLWYRTPSRRWFVTDADSADFLSGHGIPRERVSANGFPVALPFADRPGNLQPPEPASPAAPRRVLFMINSGRSAALPIARDLLQHRDWRITFTAGRDEALRRQLEAMVRNAPGQGEVLGWTDRIPELLMSHHVVISKAGGATTQESIAALCPMIVSQIVPGQEEGNFELLRRHEAGALATTPVEITATLQRAFAQDAALWRRWRHNLRGISRPAAARDIVQRVADDLAGDAMAGRPGQAASASGRVA